MGDWFADERIWRIFGDCMFGEAQFTAAADSIDELLALAGNQPQRILDLGCGPGRHAIPLAARGLKVSALDLSEYLVGLGQQRAAAAEVELEWIQTDMRSFERPGSFDLIVCMWTSFGYFDDPADDLTVLRQCYRNLAPGGRLMIDVAGKESVLRNLQPVHLTEYDNGSILVERPLLEADMCRYSNQWLLLKDGRYHSAHWHHNLYSGKELADLFDQAQFEEIAIYGGLQGQPYDLDAERLLVIGQRGD